MYVLDVVKCGCGRCNYNRALMALMSQVCCDACHPEAFVRSVSSEHVPKATRAKRKMNVPSCPSPTYSRELTAALDRWRREQLAREGFAAEDFYGLQLLMSNKILRRIIDLAYSGRLTSASVLAEQTDWCGAYTFGDAILGIINDVGPPTAEHTFSPESVATLPSLPSTSTAFEDTAPQTHTPISSATDTQPPSLISSATGTTYRPHVKKFSTADKENVATGPSATLRKTTARRQCRNCGAANHIGKYMSERPWVLDLHLS